MFGLSLPETLLIVCVILIVFGPEQLPDIARKAGKLMGQVRGQLDSVRREFYNTVYTPQDYMQEELRDLKRELKTLTQNQDPLCPDYSPEIVTQVQEGEEVATVNEDVRAKNSEGEAGTVETAESDNADDSEPTKG